jgi:hypothetical protein
MKVLSQNLPVILWTVIKKPQFTWSVFEFKYNITALLLYQDVFNRIMFKEHFGTD